MSLLIKSCYYTFSWYVFYFFKVFYNKAAITFLRKNANEPSDAISKEELLKGAHRKVIKIIRNQEELLKKFKQSDELFSWVGLYRSKMYFKICLYKFLCIFPILKKSTFTSSSFKNNFKLTKKVCKSNVDMFSGKK